MGKVDEFDVVYLYKYENNMQNEEALANHTLYCT